MIENKYDIILMDPPQKYANWSDKAHGAAKSHYDTMSYDQLKALPVGNLGNDNSLLFLWGTWPKFGECVDLVRHYGYDIVTGFPWIKTVPSSGEIRRGIGFWVQGASEYMLIGRRGKVKRKDRKNPVIGLLCGENQQFYAPIRAHSQKPEDVQDFIDRNFQNETKIELFATRERTGWFCAGLETGYLITSQGISKLQDLKVSKEEYDNIRELVENPPAPTQALRDIMLKSEHVCAPDCKLYGD